MNDHTRSPLVAVVDDDQSIREALASLIEAFGFDVALFSSAEEFLGSTHVDRTDCLLLDIRMKGMNGLELQSKLAERDSEVPIVFLTAHGNHHQERQALRAGATAFLRKPFNAVQMLRILEATLDKPKRDYEHAYENGTRQ